MKSCLAIDIGASSGRHIVGWMEGGEIKTKEVYRFPNQVRDRGGHLAWDVDGLLFHVKTGIDAARAIFDDIRSLSIDTWGVDYVLMRGDQEVLPCFAYRDDRTEAVIPQVHGKMPFAELYRRTGIQYQPFNTVYQLYADMVEGRLEGVTDFLMLPEYLLYKLSGVKAHEYTNATTGGLVSAETGEYDMDIVRALGLPERLFGKLSRPGTVVGQYLNIPCVLCASHDTASAVEGIPMDGCHPYISSGTWSLLGVKTEKPITTPESMESNWSNEGGVGYNRYQKNIMGMWLVNRLRDELCPHKDFAEIVREAGQSTYGETVDASDPGFLAPESMKDAFDERLKVKPASDGDYFRCAYMSLALSYKQAVEELERNTGTTYEKIYVVGGGAKNELLNRMAAYAIGKQVIAMPIEATALGNLKIQMAQPR